MIQTHKSSPNSLGLKAWQGTCIFLFFKSKRTSTKVVTTASAYGLDLPWRFRVIYPIFWTAWGALETQSTKRQRLELYFTWLPTAGSPSPGYTNVFVSGLGAGGWLNTDQVPLHLGHVLPHSQPPPAPGGGKAVATAHTASAGWGKAGKEPGDRERWSEVLPATKLLGSDTGIPTAAWVTSESSPQKRMVKLHWSYRELEIWMRHFKSHFIIHTLHSYLFLTGYPSLLCQHPLCFTSCHQALFWWLLFNFSTAVKN